MIKLPKDIAQQAIGLVLMVTLWLLFRFGSERLKNHLQITR